MIQKRKLRLFSAKSRFWKVILLFKSIKKNTTNILIHYYNPETYIVKSGVCFFTTDKIRSGWNSVDARMVAGKKNINIIYLASIVTSVNYFQKVYWLRYNLLEVILSINGFFFQLHKVHNGFNCGFMTCLCCLITKISSIFNNFKMLSALKWLVIRTIS